MPVSFDLKHQHDDVESKIAVGLERLSQAFRALAWERAKSSGLSPIQLQILVHLRHHPPSQARVGVLAQVFDITPATVSDAVSALVAKGHLERSRSVDDGRVVTLMLTDSGSFLAAEIEDWVEPVRRELTYLPGAEKLELMDRVMGLIESLQRAGIISVARTCRSCTFFRADAHSGESPHHCALLDLPLARSQLRIDCPEHQPSSH